MFDPSPDLAPDLEWMLQSGQVSLETLAQALVQEHYPAVYSLALALLDDQNAARSAARQVFANALAEIYRFRGGESILGWLYGIVQDTCAAELEWLNHRRSIKAALPWLARPTDLGESLPETELDATAWLAIDALPQRERLVLFMHYLLDWDQAQIADALRSTSAGVGEMLEAQRQLLLTTVWLPFRLAATENRQSWGERIEQFLKQTLQKRWPARRFTTDELEKLAQQAVGRQRLVNARWRIKSMGKELALVGLTILVIFGVIIGANRLWPEPEPTPAPTRFIQRVVTELVYPTRGPPPVRVTDASAAGILDLPQDAFYTVRMGDTLPEIADLLGVTLESLRTLNRLPAGKAVQAGQILLNPLRFPQVQPPATSMPTIPLLPTLEPSMNADFILERFQAEIGRLPDNVWFDAQIMDYGPVSYIGPAKVARVQGWFSQDQALVLYGDLDLVLEVWLWVAQSPFIAFPGENQPQFLPVQKLPETPIKLFLDAYARGEFDIRGITNTASQPLSVSAPEEIASRPAIVLLQLAQNEAQSTLRYWVDASTGFILRRQIFTSDGKTLLKETVFQQIAYNIDLPQDLFAPSIPWRGGYAASYTGEPLGLGQTDIPPAREQLGYNSSLPMFFSIAQSKLTFQFPRVLSLWGSLMPVDLFADGYYLGSAYFGDPWQTICDRSPDGEKLAFIGPPEESGQTFLRWFGLGQPPGQLQAFYDDPHTRLFAFSPDSKRLAVFGQYDPFDQGGSLYVLDIQTKEAVFLADFADIKSLVWSPDGKALAFIGRNKNLDYEDFVYVLNAQTGVVDYFASVDYESNAAPDWPPLAWGVVFPVEMEMLEQCALPDAP